MNDKIKIMMVEDHPEYREIVELAIGRQPDMELVSQFGTSERALRSLERFATLLDETRSAAEFVQAFEAEFTVFKSAGWDGVGGGVLA